MSTPGRRQISLPETDLVLLEQRPATAKPLGVTLFVPGLTGSKEDGEALLPLLAEGGYHAFSLDQPGQYESHGPADPDRYTTSWLGGVTYRVGRLLQQELGGPLHLIGHSFGGLVARAAVIDHPGTFRSLTLLCSGPGPIGGERGERAALLPLLVADLGLTATDPDGAGMRMIYELNLKLRETAGAAPAVTAEEAAFERECFTSTSLASLLGMAQSLMTEPDRTSSLADAGLPVLVCCGENDDGWRPELQREMAAALGTELVVIPSAAHAPAAEQPEATAAELLRFWRDLTNKTGR